MSENLEAVLARQSDIAQQQVERPIVERADRFGVRRGRYDIDPFLPKPFGHRFEQMAVVVNKQ